MSGSSYYHQAIQSLCLVEVTSPVFCAEVWCKSGGLWTPPGLPFLVLVAPFAGCPQAMEQPQPPQDFPHMSALT